LLNNMAHPSWKLRRLRAMSAREVQL